MKVKVKKLRSDAMLPHRATALSAGADLYVCTDKKIVLMPGDRKTLHTGIAIELTDPGYGAFIFPRSSLSTQHGISLPNCVGVVDADYRGEIVVPVVHLGKKLVTIHHGDRIAQLVLLPVDYPVFQLAEELSETERGTGGFGSTGR